MMAYGVNFQFYPKDNPHGRPIDSGAALHDHPATEAELVLLPNVGDYVQYDRTLDGGEAFEGTVKSKLFRYTVANDGKQWCQINIVVEEDDTDVGKLIKE